MKDPLSLEERIEIELKSYDGLMGIYLNDGKGNVYTNNADEVFETASTIKVYILAALYDQVEKGEKSLSDLLEYQQSHYVDGSGILNSLEIGTKLSVKNLATLMIIVSDNIATNILIDYLGIDKINAYIQSIGCKNTVLLHPLHFDQYEGLGKTTPREYASMFERMVQHELISEKASKEMLSILEMQHYNTMLTGAMPPYYLDSDNYEEQLIHVASKSGSMDACRNDGGVVTTPYGSYVIVLFNKGYADPMYYSEHPAIVFGSRISRLVLEQYLALKGRFHIS